MKNTKKDIWKWKGNINEKRICCWKRYKNKWDFYRNYELEMENDERRKLVVKSGFWGIIFIYQKSNRKNLHEFGSMAFL